MRIYYRGSSVFVQLSKALYQLRDKRLLHARLKIQIQSSLSLFSVHFSKFVAFFMHAKKFIYSNITRFHHIAHFVFLLI